MRLAIKRAFDLCGSIAAVVVLSPLLASVAAALLLTQGRPIFFRQERTGLDGRTFTIVKFRTMRAPSSDEVWFLTDAKRSTRIGRFLRSTSIDELPELWNVIRGQMSLVGPRPLLTRYVPHYTADEWRRHEMRPGITGWAAVCGRHSLAFEERLRLDVSYVDNWSFRLDFRILALTVAQVLGRRDVVVAQDMAEISVPPRFADTFVAAPGETGASSVADAGVRG